MALASTTTEDTDGRVFASKTLQTYLNSFFANVGGSPWPGVQTQYCRNVYVRYDKLRRHPGRRPRAREAVTDPDTFFASQNG
jgi:hypothetical protein